MKPVRTNERSNFARKSWTTRWRWTWRVDRKWKSQFDLIFELQTLEWKEANKRKSLGWFAFSYFKVDQQVQKRFRAKESKRAKVINMEFSLTTNTWIEKRKRKTFYFWKRRRKTACWQNRKWTKNEKKRSDRRGLKCIASVSRALKVEWNEELG